MTDLNSARLAFNSHAALKAEGVKRIERDKLNAAMQSWWDAKADSPLVLLGREGVGKTWEALGWWLGASARDPDFALTQIGRASCREECVGTSRSRWSPFY